MTKNTEITPHKKWRLFGQLRIHWITKEHKKKWFGETDQIHQITQYLPLITKE